MAEPSFDAERIFAVLAEHKVDYVVVGGVAVQVYGHVRMTNDLDLIPAPDRANLARLAEALHELKAHVLNPGSEKMKISASMLPRATLWQFSTELGDIDLLHDAPGAAPFDELRSRSLLIELGANAIPIAGRDDLISMKRASARPIDLEDIAALTQAEHEDN